MQAEILKIALDVPLNRLFDYSNNGFSAQVGSRAVVSFAGRNLVGIVMEVVQTSDVPIEKLKPVIHVFDDVVFDSKSFKLLNFCADYYHYPLGQALISALPLRLRQIKPAVTRKRYIYSLNSHANLDEIPKKLVSVWSSLLGSWLLSSSLLSSSLLALWSGFLGNYLLGSGLLGGWLCSSLLALWSCFLSNYLLGGWLCSSLLALWSSFLSSNGWLCSSLLALWSGFLCWCCWFCNSLLALWSRFLSCSHVDLLSEWFDPSPNLFKEKRDIICANFPLFEVKNDPRVAPPIFSTFMYLRKKLAVVHPHIQRIKNLNSKLLFFFGIIQTNFSLSEGKFISSNVVMSEFW